MPDQRAINRNETQILDQALRQQETIKRISRRRFRLRNRQNVVVIDGDERQPDTVDDARKPFERDAEGHFPEPHFYGDFPKARDACMHVRMGIGKRAPNFGVQRAAWDLAGR
jgi:hypothetical protein